MASVERLYAAEVRNKFGGFHGNWFPDTRVELGDLGAMNSGLFRTGLFCTLGSLRKLGVSVGESRVGEWQTFEYSSSSSVKVNFKVKGKANPDLPAIPLEEAGIGFEFGSAGAFAIIAQQGRTLNLVDINAIGQQLKPLFALGKVDSRSVVVTGLFETKNTQLLISQDGKSKIQMIVKGVSLPRLELLGKADVSFTVVSEHKRIVKILNPATITPFIRLHWFAPTTGKPRICKTLMMEPQLSQTLDCKFSELTDIDSYEQVAGQWDDVKSVGRKANR